mgnify:FL=1
MEYTDRELLDKAKEAMVYSYSPIQGLRSGLAYLQRTDIFIQAVI